MNKQFENFQQYKKTQTDRNAITIVTYMVYIITEHFSLKCTMLYYIAQVQFYISQVYVLIMNKEMIQFP